MTLDELSMLQNATLDATEAYVDERLKPENLPFARNEIGTVIEVTEDRKKRYHTIRVGSATRYKKYKNVLSVGNVRFEPGNVVLLIIPSGQESQSFILGKLDSSPANIIGGTINIGEIPGSDPIDYYFKVDDSGHVSIRKGGFEYGWDETLQDYTYKINGDGVYSGIYADEDGNKQWHFQLTNKGAFNITKGSIHLGKIGNTRKYHFNIEENGTMKVLDDDGKETFSINDKGQTVISGYLEDGAFNNAARTNRTTIDGRHVATGYIMSPNLRGQDNDNLDSYDNEYTTSGMIIGLEKGFISSKKFRISSNGDAYFKGNIEAEGGDIGGWSIESNRLYKKRDSAGNTATELSPDHIRFSDYRSGGWPRTFIKSGQTVINTGGLTDNGLFVCNGGGNTDARNNGAYMWVSASGISKYNSSGGYEGDAVFETSGNPVVRLSYANEHYVTSGALNNYVTHGGYAGGCAITINGVVYSGSCYTYL